MTIDLRYSSINTFLACPQKYYRQFVLKEESDKFNINFFIGSVIHFGINKIYEKDKNFIANTIVYFHTLAQEKREKLLLNDDAEQALILQENIIKGILLAYKIRYAEWLNNTTHIANEVELSTSIFNGINLSAHLDNILVNNGVKLLHELKSTKAITVQYIRNIQTDLQTSLYFHLYNKLNPEDPFKGIVYDIIRKPSIRQKKNETLIQYMDRLAIYYSNKTDPTLFYMEKILEPIISADRIYNLIEKIGNYILNSKDINDFYPNTANCYKYGMCEYYYKCHNIKELTSINSLLTEENTDDN